MSETVHYKGKMQHIKKDGRTLEETLQKNKKKSFYSSI